MKTRPAIIEVLETRIAPAGVIVVTTLEDTTDPQHNTGSLRDAIYLADAASGGTDIIFQATAHGKSFPLTGIITLGSDLPSITNDVTITGPGITINGAGKSRDLSITGGAAVQLNNLTLTNGKAANGAGLYINDYGGTVTIDDCVITGNHAAGANGVDAAGHSAKGGGIAIMAGMVTIENKSVISGNTATGGAGSPGDYNGGSYHGGDGKGGGIYNAATLTIVTSRVTGNTVTGGRGGAGQTYSQALSTTGSYGGNGGSADGGGIDNSGGTLTIQQSVIFGNAAHGGAGGNGGRAQNGANGANFHVSNGTAYAPTSGTEAGNGYNGGAGGDASGAGIRSTVSSTSYVTVTQSTVSGNIAIAGRGGNGTAGGAGGNGGAGGVFAGNRSTAGAGGYGGYGGNGGNGGQGLGGGLSCDGSLIMKNSTVSGNTAISALPGAAGVGGAGGTGYPHGMRGGNGSPGYFRGSHGGGIDSKYGSIFLSQVTIANNTAGSGGGVRIYQDYSAEIHNSTIAYNKAAATYGGGGLSVVLDSNNDPVNVVSSIICANSQTDVNGAIVQTNSLVGFFALLGPLGFHHGGLTETIIPSKNSPAVVGGPGANPDALTTDQNGDAFGASIEIGAVQTFS